MRTVQTFILRLLVDPAEPDALRGALQPVPEGEAQPFIDEKALLALLCGCLSEIIRLSGHTKKGTEYEDLSDWTIHADGI